MYQDKKGQYRFRLRSRNGKIYYGCENNPTCDFMTWDVPVKVNCPVCGRTMFKKAGRGAKKPFCIHEDCSNFTPEEKRGGWKKPAEGETEEKKPAAKKTAAKKTTAKKTTAKKTTARKTTKKAEG